MSKTMNRLSPTERSLLQTLLPYGIRARMLKSLAKLDAQGFERLRQMAGALAGGYWVQASAAFNRWGHLLYTAVTVFCFAFSGAPKATAWSLAVVLVALTVRSAFTHGQARDAASCALRTGTDVAVTMLSLVTAHILLKTADPHSAMQNSNFWRGAVVCIPVIAMLRMAFAVKPDMKARTFGDVGISPRRFYLRIKMLNFLWHFTFLGVAACNVTDIPHYWLDFARGFVPIMIFRALWWIQKEPFRRLNDFVTIFTNIQANKLRKMAASLAPGIKPKQPFRLWFVIAVSSLCALVGLEMVDAVFPWLTGHSPEDTFFRAMGGVIAGSTTIVALKFVRDANAVAVEALETEAKRLEEGEGGKGARAA